MLALVCVVFVYFAMCVVRMYCECVVFEYCVCMCTVSVMYCVFCVFVLCVLYLYTSFQTRNINLVG